ncbi:MAG: hypothetical protein ACKVX7_11100 [Planctomycetota bacterium]
MVKSNQEPRSADGAPADAPTDGPPDGDDALSRQYFPDTQQAWIHERLDQGTRGYALINEHVMHIYYRPLQYYYLGLRGQRRTGVEAADVVGGFFADRLARPDFFHKWKDSGIRLRRWLMNGLHFYLKERVRQDGRGRSNSPELEDLQVAAPATDPDQGFEREFAQSLVSEGLVRVQQQCQEKGLVAHWEIFIRHHYHDEAYQDFSHEYGIEPVRASVMARTVRDRFRAAIRELLIEDGVKPTDVEPEIRSLLETLT